MPSSINQVADGQRDGLLLLQKRFLSKGNLCFFLALKQPYQMSKWIWHMLYDKNPLQWTFSNVSGCWLYFFPVHGLFDKPHNRTLLLRGNSAANDLMIPRRTSQLLWCRQDVWFVNTCWLWKRFGASHFSRHKRTENTCLSDTRLADFGNAGRGTVVQVRQIATKSCRLFEWLLIGWGKGCASTKILTIESF